MAIPMRKSKNIIPSGLFRPGLNNYNDLLYYTNNEI